jgi:hypothetical protein
MQTALDTARPRSVTEQATEAVASAYEESLYKGLHVVVAEGDVLIERHLSGFEKELKRLPPLQKPAHRTLKIR